MSSVIKRRFIAGAVCPQCQLIDKLVVYENQGAEFCSCVRCGYTQQQEQEPKPVQIKLGQKEQIITVVRPLKKSN